MQNLPASIFKAMQAVVCVVLASLFAVPVSGADNRLPLPDAGGPVVLTMGSWRTDDVTQMNRILDVFHQRHPQITVRFDPTNASEYDAVLRAQLESGSGPDLFYLRSYAVSRGLFEDGFLASLDDLPGLAAGFKPEMIAPWATETGQAYGVPFIAVSHGIYYNQSIFNRFGLKVPLTWEKLLETARELKQNGITPFANASGEPWTIAEIVFMNLAPNFIGGLEGRRAYLSGQRCFNDSHVVAAFKALEDIAPFLPKNQQVLRYADSLQLFVQGKAAMWLGGSWDIPFFESENPAFEWSVFAPPPKAGDSGYITFHLDAGMGMNAASSHKKEARLFLEWMTSDEFASLLGNELPGFFSMHTWVPKLENPHAQAFLALNQGRGLDVRFAWEKLRQGDPSGYQLMQDNAVAVINGRITPKQAADQLQIGLVKWFQPARNCGS